MDTKPTILIVDDEPSNLDVLSGLLKSEGTVLVAKSGEQALARMQGASRVDLVLLDVMMPGMDGYEVCRRLKAEERTRSTPVIFVTAMSDVSDETQGLALGAVDYVTKPIRPAVVEARVRGVLERQHLQRQLDQMRQRLAAMIVHDLRNPLSVIHGFAELAMLDPASEQSPDLRTALQRIVSSAERASSLVTQMLDLSQLQSGNVKLERQPLDLSALLAEIVSDQRLLAKTKRIRLEGRVEPGLIVNADPLKLSEVVVNLIGNALKFAPESGRVELEAWHCDNGAFVISVSDNGPGIPEDQLTNVFAPWEQLGRSSDHAVKGYGLGLAICLMIVKAHGGDIRAERGALGGACFKFTLPAGPAPAGISA